MEDEDICSVMDGSCDLGHTMEDAEDNQSYKSANSRD